MISGIHLSHYFSDITWDMTFGTFEAQHDIEYCVVSTYVTQRIGYYIMIPLALRISLDSVVDSRGDS